MHAIRIDQTGGPEVLRLEEMALPEPGEGQARVRLVYSGVNFIDVYQRTGLYPVERPFTPGNEGSGVVDVVGPGVRWVAPGDRVAYANERGSYAEYAVVPEWKLAHVPDEIGLDTAAAVMLQGMTAHYLVTDTFPLETGHTALVHAAAGGVGLLLVQLAVLRGARVIGTVSTAEKAELAREAGAAEVVIYTEESFYERARASTSGRGVDVAYDSVGRDTWEDSLQSLRPRGMLVLYGNASGPVPPVDPLLLSRSGSLFLTRPTLAHYVTTREELLRRSGYLMRTIVRGELKVRIDRVLPLESAAEAHRLLESRQTAGKLLLSVGNASPAEAGSRAVNREKLPRRRPRRRRVPQRSPEPTESPATR
jgi:NADPH2:quinone reductase